MNQTDFALHAGEMIKAMEELLVVKGGEYAGSEDRLANFRRGAALAGVTPLQTALIYASKHWDSICTYVKDTAAGKIRPRSESMQGRFQDLANYCLLMAALVKEDGEMTLKRATDVPVNNPGIDHVGRLHLHDVPLGDTREEPTRTFIPGRADFRGGQWVPSPMGESFGKESGR